MKLQESREFAAFHSEKPFRKHSMHNGNVHDFGIKRAHLLSSLGVDVPAGLAEVSCLSNVRRERTQHRGPSGEYCAISGAGISGLF